MGMSVAEGGVTHGHEFDKKEDEYCYENYALAPGVFGYSTGQAWIGEGFIGRSEELDGVSRMLVMVRTRAKGTRGLTWMNAVAKITPDPKYFAKKNANSGTLTPLLFLANTGKMAPSSC